MDKRSFLFIFLITVTFFGINQWFSSKRSDEAKRAALERVEKKKQAQEQFDRVAQDLRVDPSRLSIHSLYKEPDRSNFVQYAYFFEGKLFTFAWERKQPKVVYTQSSTPLQLLYSQESKHAPIVYKEETAGSTIYLPRVPTQYARLQLLCFSCDEEPTTYYAEYQDEALILPSGAPNKDALVLYQKNDVYYPVGVYLNKKKSIRYFNDYLKIKPFVQLESSSEDLLPAQEEEFYVLENEYQQLVFSTKGGALAEINLPLRSKQNQESVIHPIQFDRILTEKHPENARFPSFHYSIAHNGRIETINQGQLGGYYPLLRRTLFNPNGTILKAVSSRFYAATIFSDDTNPEDQIYKVKHFDEKSIVFELSEPHRRITKTFSFSTSCTSPYVFDLKVNIEGDRRNLWMSSGIPEVELVSGSAAPALKYQILKGKKPSVEKIKLPNATYTVSSVYPTWISNSNGFFGIILDPLTSSSLGYKVQKIGGSLVPTRLSLIDPQYDLYPAQNYPGYEMFLPIDPSFSTSDFRLYSGPYEGDILKEADRVYTDAQTGANPHYIGAQSFHGWFSFISEPFAKFLFVLMEMFYKITRSWGLSIILLTVVLRIMLYPLNNWSIKANARMQEVAPLAKKIQEKYKKDPKRLQIELMSLYREKKANPAMGCFPMLIQMPFLIGMFDLLRSTFELRGVSFIPGWIDNLTAPDVLFSWNYPIFFIGTEFHFLPILLGLVMYFQQKMTTKLPKDKSAWTDQQKQQRTMGNIMVLFFTFIFYKFPSGLNLYWLSSSLLGVLQQYYQTNKVKNMPAIQTNMPPPKRLKSKKKKR